MAMRSMEGEIGCLLRPRERVAPNEIRGAYQPVVSRGLMWVGPLGRKRGVT
jgi:hypothetical protein